MRIESGAIRQHAGFRWIREKNSSGTGSGSHHRLVGRSIARRRCGQKPATTPSKTAVTFPIPPKPNATGQPSRHAPALNLRCGSPASLLGRKRNTQWMGVQDQFSLMYVAVVLSAGWLGPYGIAAELDLSKLDLPVEESQGPQRFFTRDEWSQIL